MYLVGVKKMIALLKAARPAVLRTSSYAFALVLVLVRLFAEEQPPATTAAALGAPEPPDRGTVTIRGRCLDHVDRSALAEATVRLFEARGRTAPIVEIARSVTDPQGRFAFRRLEPPRNDDPVDPLIYLVFAEVPDRPIGVGGIWGMMQGAGEDLEIRILREKTMFAGTVRDPSGRPVAGAAVGQWAIDGRPVPGILSATTGPDGRFAIAASRTTTGSAPAPRIARD